jgi:hypothetical protein
MSFSFALRRDGVHPVDFKISGGTLAVATGADAARDRIFTALSTQRGEWFLDADDGVPYYPDTSAVNPPRSILGGKMTEGEVSAILRRRILSDPEASRIVSMTVRQNGRAVSVSAEVQLSLRDGSSELIRLEV